jgi:hypothetical protein
MNFIVEIKGDRVYVHVQVPHIRGTRKKARSLRTKNVIAELKRRGYDGTLVPLRECVVHNYQTEERCHGLWVFVDLALVEKREEVLETLTERVQQLEEEPPKPKRRRRTRKIKEE